MQDTIFISPRYFEYINSIISSRGQWSEEVRYSTIGFQRHHIIPKCFGGLPQRVSWKHHENIIWLYPNEHFIAHRILAEEHPNNYPLVDAFWRMVHCKNGRYIATPEEYQEAYNLMHNVSVPQEKINKWHTKMDGRKHYTNGITEIVVYDTNVPEGFYHGRLSSTIEKIAVSNRGKKRSLECCQRFSEQRKGRIPWNKGIPMKDDTKKLLSVECSGWHHTDEAKQKISKASLNRGKSVICLETGQIWPTCAAASRDCNGAHVSDVCLGKLKKSKNLTFMFLDEYNKNKKEI